MLHVIRADAMGMCFGVRDALELAFDQPRPQDVAIHGELVHNEEVRDRLRKAGFSESGEAERGEQVSDRPAVLITAHGVSRREHERLSSLGKQVVDTTCPLVRRAHDAALRLAADARHVLVVGKPGHVEVEGLVGDLVHFDIVPDVVSVRNYGKVRLGVLAQTTVPVQHADDVLAAIRAQNPEADVQFVDTICEPTKQRIRAVEELAARVDCVVVVGGHNSNNTQRLADLAQTHGARVVRVSTASELQPEDFVDGETVGLTAGTSTLPETVSAVERALCAMELPVGRPK